MAFNSSWEQIDKSVSLDMYWRSRPLAFSLPPLPRAVRIGEVYPQAGTLGEDFASEHLAALVAGHRFAHRHRLAVEDDGDAGDDGLDGGVIHFSQRHEAGVRSTSVPANERLPAPLITRPSFGRG